MSVLKAGEVIAIRTTGEFVYFTGKQLDSGQWEVHRPKLTQDGIDHVYDSFEAGELETVEEHIEREVKEAFMKIAAQKKVMEAKMKALEAVEPNGNIDPESGPKTYFN